jgi:quercetin dioxygenase-like cupin family protein
MLHVDLQELEVQPHHPTVLQSNAEGRAIALALPAGEQMQEHQVHERSYMTVVSGEIEVTQDGGDATTGGTGALFVFEPGERRTVSATADARLLLVLTPWPGVGHPSET